MIEDVSGSASCAAGHDSPQWQAETIRRLLALDGVSPSLLIADTSDQQCVWRNGRPASSVLRAATPLCGTSFNNGYVARRSRSLARVDCGDLFDSVPVIEAAPERRGKFSEYFS